MFGGNGIYNYGVTVTACPDLLFLTLPLFGDRFVCLEDSLYGPAIGKKPLQPFKV